MICHDPTAPQNIQKYWNRMAAENADAVLLIGDVPSIDSTKLERQTQRHREFAAVREYQELLRSRPCWWTWDDHDFAGHDTDGLARGKENSRLIYTRYRPQLSYGVGAGAFTPDFAALQPAILSLNAGER